MLKVESSTSEDIIELENIPFNPHCDACNKNHKPSQEKLAMKRTLLKQTRSSIEDIDKSLYSLTDILAGLNISVKESKRNGLGIDIALQNREYYEANVERMTQEVKDWTAAAKDWKKLNTYHKELKSFETKYSIISWKLYEKYLTESHDLRVKRDMLREDLAKCTMFCKDASIFIPEYNTAKTELEAYVEWDAWMLKNNVLIDELRNSEIELYKYWKAYRDHLALTLSSLQNEVVHIDKFITEHERWIIDINKANSEYNVLKQWKEWKNIRDRLERDILVATWHRNMRDISVAMNINEITLSKIKAIENAKEAVERWTQVKYMLSLHALDKEIQEKKHIANDLHKQISELTFRIAEISENSNIDNVYNSELLRLKADLDKLTLFRDVFVGVKGTDGMKSAIYRERVIPLIENEVNSFLNDLEEFRLTIEMNGAKLIYKVHDRGNKVLLGHCSGYQKFMIGLAMRTALSRIGAAGQSIKHLIIDEGFGCCDSNNIQRAQQIVRELMMRGQYKSIILMSHLDAIRDVSQSSINIKRDSGKFSYIQFGNPSKKYKKIKHTGNVGDNELNVSTIEPKPRGRPRKTANKAI
ncbi:MAG: hypothetical protein EB127_19215 [Alphaproteobacteria bacterium]|nr:hypothetical protein [Alphaproteobacteria bacterium]